MNMTTTWRFSNLVSIADHMENKAREYRASADRFKKKSPTRAEYMGRAAEAESMAYLLRHTKLGEEK